MENLRDTSGQSSVELVCLMPLVAALVIGCWQAIIVGHTWWLVAVAARAATRAEVIGASPRTAARLALPRGSRNRLRVSRRAGGVIELRLAVPMVFGSAALGSATARVGAVQDRG